MAINILNEKVYTFREAASFLPRRRRGKMPHVATLYRWASQGLETIQIGGQRCTSVEALQRFFDSVSNNSEPHRQSNGITSDRQRQDIDKKLKQFGL